MQSLFNQFSQVLGITLLHSLWQGLIIYVLLRMLFLCLPSASANSKYNMALLALAASVLWPIITLVVEISKHPFITPIIDTDTGPLAYVPMIHTYPAETINSWQFAIDNYMPYLVVLWFIGIALSSARLLWGWRNIYQIKQSVSDSPVLKDSIQIISRMLKINKQVGAFLSEHVDVPCIVGFLKPMIILPAGIITQFSAEQIQSILVHEMAHIRRNDYFINLLQQVIGILLFFNPFTHLINRLIYTEREHCCDDLVLQITGQPLVYAQTLLQLEETRNQDFQLALAATGKKYYLLNRIKRIMETKKQVSNIRHIVAAVLLLLGSMGTIAWLNPEIKDGKLSISPVKQIAFSLPDGDTARSAVKAKKAVAAKHKVAAKSKAARSGKNTSTNFDIYSNNPVLAKLGAEVEKHGKALNKLYNNTAYRSIEKEMELKGHTLDSIYNRPELKELQEKMDKQSEAFNKINESPEIKELQEKMEALGKGQSAYFETPEYKKLQKTFEVEGKWFEQENASKSPDFKTHSEALKKAGEELRQYTSNSQYKADNEQLKAYGKKMREYYDSPEYKKQREVLKQTSEEIRKAFQDPAIKQQQKELNALSKKLRDYTNSPEIKNEKELLNQASAHLREYTNSPAFKKLREENEKNIKAMHGVYYNTPDTTNKSGK